MAVGAVSDRRLESISTLRERRYTNPASHKCHPPATCPRFRERELIGRFPIAPPTRRVPTIFRSTKFLKANMGRVARRFFPEFPSCTRVPAYFHRARQRQ